MGARGRIGTATLPCLLVLVAILATGCDGSSRAEDPSTSSPSATTRSPGQSPSESPSRSADPSPSQGSDGQSAQPALDPAHAVDPPGRLEPPVQPADIVVNRSEPIDPATVRSIRRMAGVQDVEAVSMAQFVIENHALRVLAVDPATYRNFTPTRSAQTQRVWARVAQGELALRPGLAKRVPQDEHGFTTLGTGDSATPVHIGALAPLSVQADAVVNETWIKTLQMTPDNALLIRTGSTAPLTLRKPIERTVGADASVQMVDAVARYGLDPDVVQTALVVGTIADAVGTFRYTVLGGGRIAPQPSWVSSHIVTESVPILGQVTCNKLIFPQLRAALEDVQAQGLTDKIHPDEYAGCYYPRFIAGTTKLSNHSFGLALDLNTPGNQRGTAGEMDRGVVAIFKHWGFTWGGDWHYTDPMHFEMNTLVSPR